MDLPTKHHVIIEGADGCGKTSLAQHLERAHGYAYHHEGPPPPNLDLASYYLGIIVGRRLIPTVYDRMFFGEMVYGPIFRGELGLIFGELEMLKQEFEDMGGVSVLMLPRYDVLYRQLYDQKREFTDFEKNEVNHHRVHVGYWGIKEHFDVVMPDFAFDCAAILGVDRKPSCDRWLPIAQDAGGTL